MKLQDLVREIVAQTVSEKHLTAAEKNKKEDIVKAMKKTFKGPEPVMYAIATKKAEKLAEDDIDETRVSQDNVVDYLAHVLEYVWTAGKGNNSIDFSDMAQSMYFDMFGGDEMNEAFKIDFDDEGNIIKTPAKDVPKTPSSGEVEIPKLDKVELPKNKEVNEENNVTPYKKGEIANNNNIHYSKNPYPKGSKEYDDFYDGWMNAETEKQMQHDNETFRKETGGRYDESQQELEEFMIRRWQYYAGIK